MKIKIKSAYIFLNTTGFSIIVCKFGGKLAK